MHIKFIKFYSYGDWLRRGTISFDKDEIFELKPYRGSDKDFAVILYRSDPKIERKINITKQVFKYFLRKNIIEIIKE